MSFVVSPTFGNKVLCEEAPGLLVSSFALLSCVDRDTKMQKQMINVKQLC